MTTKYEDARWEDDSDDNITVKIEKATLPTTNTVTLKSKTTYKYTGTIIQNDNKKNIKDRYILYIIKNMTQSEDVYANYIRDIIECGNHNSIESYIWLDLIFTYEFDYYVMDSMPVLQGISLTYCSDKYVLCCITFYTPNDIKHSMFNLNEIAKDKKNVFAISFIDFFKIVPSDSPIYCYINSNQIDIITTPVLPIYKYIKHRKMFNFFGICDLNVISKCNCEFASTSYCLHCISKTRITRFITNFVIKSSPDDVKHVHKKDSKDFIPCTHIVMPEYDVKFTTKYVNLQHYQFVEHIIQ